MRSNSNIDWADVQRLKESGVPMTELAEMYGVHKDTIRYNTTAVDIQEADWGKAQALRDAGWSVGAIAKELRTTKDAVHRNTHQPVPKKRYENEWNQDEPPIMKSADLI